MLTITSSGISDTLHVDLSTGSAGACCRLVRGFLGDGVGVLTLLALGIFATDAAG